VQTLSVVGIYAATYTVVDLLYRLGPSVFVSVIRPYVFRTSDLAGREAGTRFVVRSAAVIAWANGLLTIVVVAILPRLSFLPVDIALVGPLSAGIAAFVIANSLGVALSASGQQWRLAAIISVAALVNVVLNLAADGAAGASGAAIATLISYSLLMALNASAIGLMSWRAAGSLPLLLVGLLVIGLAALSSMSGEPLLLAAAAVVILVSAPVAWRRTRTLLIEGVGLGASVSV
jgi:O-antigen/teichoic acid export membrane protein